LGAADPASLAALQAQLTARAWLGQLSLVTRPATYKDPVYIDHPAMVTAQMRSRSSTFAGRSVITWSATYRTPSYTVNGPPITDPRTQQITGYGPGYQTGGLQRSFGPEQAVVDTSDLNLALAVMLQWIQQQFDLFDQRSKAANLVPQMHP
jgi:hypothetical protein